MEYKLKVFEIFEFGQRVDKEGNPHQEDSLYPEFGAVSDNDRMFILCDGMGGHDDGEVASRTVCEEMSKSVNESLAAGGEFSKDVFDKALDAAFNALDAKDPQAESKKKMGTTMTFLKLSASGAFVGHIGDSRVYHIRPGKTGKDTEILHKTHDHSLVNDLLRVGELTPEEAKTFPRKNVLTRAMEAHLERRPKADVYTTADVRPGDYFYMCSDGMLEQMDDDRIREIFSAAGGGDSEKISALRKETADNKDNHSAIIVHITDVEGMAPKAAAAEGGIERKNAPLTAKMAQKRGDKAARAKWMLLAIAAILAVAIGLILVFA